MGHFETKSDAFSMRVYRSGPPAGADVAGVTINVAGVMVA
jgi:hypothetical protein